MALDYTVHQFDQVIRGYGQGGLGAVEQRFHWRTLNFLSEHFNVGPRSLKGIGSAGYIGEFL